MLASQTYFQFHLCFHLWNCLLKSLVFALEGLELIFWLVLTNHFSFQVLKYNRSSSSAAISFACLWCQNIYPVLHAEGAELVRQLSNWCSTPIEDITITGPCLRIGGAFCSFPLLLHCIPASVMLTLSVFAGSPAVLDLAPHTWSAAHLAVVTQRNSKIRGPTPAETGRGEKAISSETCACSHTISLQQKGPAVAYTTMPHWVLIGSLKLSRPAHWMGANCRCSRLFLSLRWACPCNT